MNANYILAIEYQTHCDVLSVPVEKYPGVCFALNQMDCRYWVLFRDYQGHRYQGAAFLQTK
jgi:hypothetical protein